MIKRCRSWLEASLCSALGSLMVGPLHAAGGAGVTYSPPETLRDGQPPFSNYASQPAEQNWLDVLARSKASGGPSAEINVTRRNYEALIRPGLDRLLARFPVDLSHEKIANVPVDVVAPKSGVAAGNRRRVLINLHGGGMFMGAGVGGQAASVPIASLGGIKVVSVDYRQGPEYRFPAASEDVAQVYRELLKQYRPQNIGIYGCSAGAWLTAESVAWFQTHHLPAPGAIGLFGSGASVYDGVSGDSAYIAWGLLGADPNALPRRQKLDYFDVPGLDMKDPLVSPLYFDQVLAKFPPTLLISGTRDMMLSDVIHTHASLVKRGVQTDLHVWEGAYHCSFDHMDVNPDVPETQEAWNVIVQFFTSRLGS